VIEAGGMLMLTIGTSLGATSAELDAARAAIAREAGVAGPIDLRPADLGVDGALLVLERDGSPTETLATAKPSPAAPYPAAFSAMLQGDRAAQATAALKAGEGRLRVRYDVTLHATRAVTASLAGDPAGIEDIAAAIDDGRLTLTLTGDPDASDALKAEARGRLIEAAGAQVARLAPGYGETGTLAASVTRTEPAPLALALTADVGAWLK
jgi:hypothetical protein